MEVVFKAFLKYLKKLDKALLFAVIICSACSVVLLYSLSLNKTITDYYYKTQLFSMVIGIVLALIITFIDYHAIAKLWPVFVPIALVFMVLTFTSLGVGVEGTDDVAWLDLKFIVFQPSEILKIAFVLSFSYHIFKVGDNLNEPLQMLTLLIHGAIPILLTEKQGDHGTALIFIVTFVVMIFSAGIYFRYILITLISLPIIAIVLWFYFLGDVQKERISIIFSPGSDPAGLEYQQDIGLYALGSGGIFGKGIFENDKSLVPEIHNDFIFSYVGQCLGFVGSVVLIVILTYICVKIISNAIIAKDKLGKSICMGSFAVIFSHVFLNIGMVLKVMPVIGVPLPYLSAGGTALISMYIILGIVLSVRFHNEKEYRMFS